MSKYSPRRKPISRGQTWGLMGHVKHSDILQTPESEHCHMLAVIVMGGSGRLNQQAGDPYYAHKSVLCTHTFCLSLPFSQLPEKQPTQQDKWLASASQYCPSFSLSLCPSPSPTSLSLPHCRSGFTVLLSLSLSLPLSLSLSLPFS